MDKNSSTSNRTIAMWVTQGQACGHNYAYRTDRDGYADNGWWRVIGCYKQSTRRSSDGGRVNYERAGRLGGDVHLRSILDAASSETVAVYALHCAVPLRTAHCQGGLLERVDHDHSHYSNTTSPFVNISSLPDSLITTAIASQASHRSSKNSLFQSE